MTISEQYDILKRLKLHRRADVTNPAIVVLCQEINRQDKALLEMGKVMDSAPKLVQPEFKEEPKTNSL